MIDTQVTLDGLNLAALPNGARATITSLEGWWDSPEPKGDEVPRVGREGDFLLPQSYQARIVQLVANIQAPNHDKLHETGEILTNLLQSHGRLEVHGHGPDQWASVQRGSKIRFTPITDKLAVFSVTLKAPDPRKFGRTRRFPETGLQEARTSMPVWTMGRYPAAPKFTVAAGYMPDGFGAYAGGDNPFRVTEGKNTGEVISADFENGAVYQDGIRIFNASHLPWLTRIDPGEHRTVNVVPATADGYGGYYVEVTDTWI